VRGKAAAVLAVVLAVSFPVLLLLFLLGTELLERAITEAIPPPRAPLGPARSRARASTAPSPTPPITPVASTSPTSPSPAPSRDSTRTGRDHHTSPSG
jgi:hypothetical protein